MGILFNASHAVSFRVMVTKGGDGSKAHGFARNGGIPGRRSGVDKDAKSNKEGFEKYLRNTARVENKESCDHEQFVSATTLIGCDKV